MAENDSNPLILDGSRGEGGGSILRVGAGLACVKNRPLKVINIRKNRNNPGLRPQHLIGIQALRTLTNGTLSDVRVGTLELDLHPGSDWRTALDLTIPTAGNVGLLMQTLHNALYRAPIEKCSIQIHGGGTYGRAAPGTSYLQNVTYALFNRLGYSVDLKVIRHGFYPKGGAEAVATIVPNPAGYRGLILEERGELESIEGCIVVEAKSPKSPRRRPHQREFDHFNFQFFIRRCCDGHKSRAFVCPIGRRRRRCLVQIFFGSDSRDRYGIRRKRGAIRNDR